MGNRSEAGSWGLGGEGVSLGGGFATRDPGSPPWFDDRSASNAWDTAIALDSAEIAIEGAGLGLLSALMASTTASDARPAKAPIPPSSSATRARERLDVGGGDIHARLGALG